MSRTKLWFLSMRPWSFTMSAISVSVGSALGALHGPFSWGLFALSLIAMCTMHGAVNLMNDYFDFTSGVDFKDAATTQYRPYPLLEGKITPRAVLVVSIILFGVATLIGCYLAWARGLTILWIGLIGLFAGIFYTAPPLAYKYKSIGEFSVFLMWGPLAVGASYFVQRQALSWQAFAVSIPFGVLVALVLYANNLRDVDTDADAGVGTIAGKLGKGNGVKVYAGLVVAAFIAVVVMSIFGPLGWWSLIVLAAAPIAGKLLKVMMGGVPIDADARTAQLDTAFGILLVASMALERLL